MTGRILRAAKNCSVHLVEHTEKVLSTLAPREEMILRLRFGIGRKASTFEEISQLFSLSTELLRQIELQALRKVRERARSIYQRTICTYGTGSRQQS